MADQYHTHDDEDHHLQQPTKSRHKVWTANPSEQWAFALDHMDAGEWDLAILHCERAVDIWPTYYDALLLMAGAYEGKGDLDASLSTAQRASEVAVAELSQAWNTLAALHLLREEYDEAITVDRVLMLVDPTKMPIACYRMAVAYTALNDLPSGERFLREAIEHRSDLYERAVGESLLSAHHEWLKSEETFYTGKS
jgi:tetratricopeptide (TPR) repeat protein